MRDTGQAKGWGGCSSEKSEVHSPARAIQTRALLRWLAARWRLPTTTTGSQGLWQWEEGGASVLRGEGGLSGSERSWLLLTSSVYWTSSTAYFSLKYSLEWILKGKHKERQGQGLTHLA